MSKTPVDKGEVMFALLALDGADHHAAANLTRRLWSEIETHRADLSAAAGELLVPLPEPGSVIAKLLRANVLMRRALVESSTRVCFIVAVGCNVQLNIVRSETLGWCATLEAARDHVIEWECDWTEAGYYSHLLLFDPGTSEVAWYRSVLPEGWVAGYGSPPVPLAPCDAPEWWNVGNPGETYLVNVLGEIETRTRLRAALERAEANNAALVAGRDQAIARVAYLERHGAEVREELTDALAEAHEGRAREIARCDALEAVVAKLPQCTCGSLATRGGDGYYYCDKHGQHRCDLPYAAVLRALEATHGDPLAPYLASRDAETEALQALDDAVGERDVTRG